MATAQDFLTSGDRNIGGITQETLDKYPVVSYFASRKAAQESGQDPNDPATLRGIARSQGHAKRMKQVATVGDRRTIERIAGIKDFGLAGPDASTAELERTGNAAQFNASNMLLRGRQATFRQDIDARNRLQEIAGMEADIRRRESVMRNKAQEELDSQISNTQNQMFVSRTTLMSQITHLSPVQQNRILSSQRGFFQNRINNLESIRKARLNAIDAQIDAEEADAQRQTDLANNRIDALDRQIKFLEGTAGDLDSAAELRIARAKEMKKKKKGEMPRGQEVLFYQIKDQMSQDKLAEGGEPTLTAGEIARAKEESKRTYEAQQAFDPGEKPPLQEGTGDLKVPARDLTHEDVQQFTPPEPRRLPVKRQSSKSILDETEARKELAKRVVNKEITPNQAGMTMDEAIRINDNS